MKLFPLFTPSTTRDGSAGNACESWPGRGSVIGGRHRVAHDRAGHASRPAAAATELATRHSEDLDAVGLQQGIGDDVAVIADDDAGLESEVVVAVAPLFAFCGARVVASPQDMDPVDLESDR